MTNFHPVTTRAADITPLRRKIGDWQGWQLDRHTFELWTEAGGYRYNVDLEQCRTSAEVLDWICQIGGKTWADDACLAGLVRAINDVLHPQANLCSFGTARRITAAQVRHLASSFVTDREGATL